jgi:hypothetical protein
MHGQLRQGQAGRAWLLAPIVLALAFLVSAPMASAAPAVASDPAGDTVTDAADDRIDAPQADIVTTWAETRGDGMALGLRVRQNVDPLFDRNWSSDATFTTWELDITGDGRRDYDVEYSRDGESKELMTVVDGDGADPDCDPGASFSADGGYTILLGRKCLAKSGILSYRVTFNYDTDVKDENANVATDASPDQGWTNAYAAPGSTASDRPAAPGLSTPAPTSAPASGTTAPPGQSMPGPTATTSASLAPSTPVATSGSSQIDASARAKGSARVTGPAATSAQATATDKGPRSDRQGGAVGGSGSASPGSPLAIARTELVRVDRLAWLASTLILADLGFLRLALRRRATHLPT